MSTHYEKCDESDPSVRQLANEVLCEFVSHKPLLDAKVTIDYLFACGGEDGAPALKLHGHKCLGICRKVNLKDRSKGCADAEICLDLEWWRGANRQEQRALLDHELHHLDVAIDLKLQKVKRDSCGRPVLNLRLHDVQIGWFNIIAGRHGNASQERIQASAIMDELGQYYWPDLASDGAHEEKLLKMAKRLVRDGKVEVGTAPITV